MESSEKPTFVVFSFNLISTRRAGLPGQGVKSAMDVFASTQD